jgi:hypothetical protein
MRSLVLVVLLAAIASGAELDDRPGQPGEWGFRPRDGGTSPTDPPAFVWRPQKGARRYELRVMRDGEVVYRAGNLDLHCHCPPRTLGPGDYAWQFRVGRGPWSKPRAFAIREEAIPFPMPPREELLARIPASHPRLFVTAETLPHLRELSRGRLAKRWAPILKRASQLLFEPPDTTEPLKYQANERRGVNDAAWRKRWWGNRKRVIEVLDGAATLAFAALIEESDAYAAQAKRLLLAACEWDPRGATGYRYNDEAGMPFAYLAARTYTWIHDRLTKEERDRVRRVMTVRMREMYGHLRPRHIWRPYSSHANRAWHWLGEVATAFHGEIEGTGDAAWFAHNVFYCAYPVWSDERGGWHEGIAYWNSYLSRVTSWLATLGPSYGIDGYRKPFFSRAGDFALYVIPPAESMGGFGDLTFGYSARRARRLMTTMARKTRNPHWQWYVEQAGGEQFDKGYMGFLQAADEPVEATAPTDLPSSALFPGVGVAALHGDLVNRELDVQVMFKSSPMGTQSHGYESQNAFLLSVAGDPIFVRTGRRDLYGSPHHRLWMWETKSVNSILVGGKGQYIHSNRPLGKITRFETGKAFDFVRGEAARACLVKTKRFTRAICFVKHSLVAIFDVLETEEPQTFDWLLHSPNRMEIDGATVRAKGRRQRATVQFLWPEGLEITQSNRFEPPPQEWVKLEQWHLKATTPEPAKRQEFITLIRCRPGDTVLEARALRSDVALGCEVALANGPRIVIAWRMEGEGPFELGGRRFEKEAGFGRVPARR